MGGQDAAFVEPITGGCLCGQLRYRATGAPRIAGYCCCGDCRRASGSGFVGFMGFAAEVLAITGEASVHALDLGGGRVADRNRCARCGSLVYGGIVGQVDSHTLYAGTLDDPSLFVPTIAIFVRGKPDWAVLPPGLTLFDKMP
jgi:hypothetical protein